MPRFTHLIVLLTAFTLGVSGLGSGALELRAAVAARATGEVWGLKVSHIDSSLIVAIRSDHDVQPRTLEEQLKPTASSFENRHQPQLVCGLVTSGLASFFSPPEAPTLRTLKIRWQV